MSQLPSLIEEIHYIRIQVRELEDSVRWYTKFLGFTLRRLTEELAVAELKAGPLLVLVSAHIDSRGYFSRNGQCRTLVKKIWR
ncbi:VOC family protein [Paenibacillus sp. CGMCC 1.16610]|uniref:Glyoxalase/fosfomycin resistance/dioxygenase domain-containing protein n=1 Tax=Paenibacillus anseongense TaxID=2682845 RepID=A0ABW9UD50_9BACL|nr:MULTISPECIES: VOC family protein [Paenibacillus]MBA2937251.1 VOC family protein [Paenibacillus sp. CGMCC 1.16610]MVQ36310.1 hypothetical protein [Paenibacillus anseongense]